MPQHPAGLPSHAEMQGDMCCTRPPHSLVLLLRLFVWRGEQLHATRLLFAQTNEFEQAADKDPVYNPGNH